MTAWRACARRLLAAALLLASVLPARAQEGSVPVPAYAGPVTDDAGVIGDERQLQLEGFLNQLREKTGVQFAVLTVASTAPEDPSVFKTRVFKAWRLGDAQRDDGLLLLVAMEQREVRFETGYGLEGTLPDGWQSRMVREQVLPRFREGQPEEGITAAVRACAERIGTERGLVLEWSDQQPRYRPRSPNRARERSWHDEVGLILLFLLLSWIWDWLNTPRGGHRGGRTDVGDGWGGGFGGWGGGFGGGGGGGDGGGGSSGGGGGGGGW